MSKGTVPKTVYMDTANWNELADGAVDPAPLLRSVDRGEYVPVLSYVHLAEFARKAEPHRSSVVGLAENLRLRGDVRWIRSSKQLLRAEAERAFLVWRGLVPHALDPFGASFPDVAEHELSWEDKAAHVLDGLPSYVALIVGGGGSMSLWALRDEYPGWRRLIRERRRSCRRLSVAERKAWVADRLKAGEMLMTPADIRLVLSEEELATFRREVDLSLCPGNRAVQAFHQGWNLCVEGEASSDLEDEIHLLGAVYCDARHETTHDAASPNFPPLPTPAAAEQQSVRGPPVYSTRQ